MVLTDVVFEKYADESPAISHYALKCFSKVHISEYLFIVIMVKLYSICVLMKLPSRTIQLKAEYDLSSFGYFQRGRLVSFYR